MLAISLNLLSFVRYLLYSLADFIKFPERRPNRKFISTWYLEGIPVTFSISRIVAIACSDINTLYHECTVLSEGFVPVTRCIFFMLRAMFIRCVQLALAMLA